MILQKQTLLSPIGLEHFFDAFALEHKRDVREAAAAANAWEIDRDDVQPNLVVKQAIARQFQLTLAPVPDDPPAKRAKKTKSNCLHRMILLWPLATRKRSKRALRSPAMKALIQIQTLAVKMVLGCVGSRQI